MNRPLKYLPTRLTASAIIEVLGKLGVEVPLAISASAHQSTEDLRLSVNAMRWQADEKALKAGLDASELTISEKFRLRYALDKAGLTG
jgi:hypothetical protein